MFDSPSCCTLYWTWWPIRSSVLNAQIATGAQAVMIFDTWGGVLTPQRLSRVLAEANGAHRRRQRECGWPKGTRHPVHQGRRPVAGAMTDTGAMRSGWTGPPILPMPAATGSTRWRCRAIWTLGTLRVAASYSPQVARCWRVWRRRPCIQSRPRHPSGREPGAPGGHGRGRARTESALPLRRLRPRLESARALSAVPEFVGYLSAPAQRPGRTKVSPEADVLERFHHQATHRKASFTLQCDAE